MATVSLTTTKYEDILLKFNIKNLTDKQYSAINGICEWDVFVATQTRNGSHWLMSVSILCFLGKLSSLLLADFHHGGAVKGLRQHKQAISPFATRFSTFFSYYIFVYREFPCF